MFRKNVAGQFVTIAAINASTGAALTGATVSARRCLDGTFAAVTGTITEDTGTGFYKFAASQADTNGNNCSYFFTATSMIPVSLSMVTTAADPTDAVRFGLTALPNVASGSAGAVITSGTGTAQLSVSSGLVTLAGVTHTGAVIPTVTTLTGHTAQTGDSYARLGAPAGVSVSADVAAAKVDTAAIKVKTDFLPNATAGAAGGLFIAGSNAATSVTTAFTANITGNLSGSVGSVSGAVGSVTGAVGSVTGNVGGNVTGSVGSVTGLTNTTIADQVWDEVLSGHAGVGSTGAALSAAGGSGDPWSTALPGAYGAGTAGNIVGTYIDAAVSSRLSTAGYTAPPAAAAVADAVWDEVLSGHLTSGTTGNALNAAGAAGDPWTTSLPGAYGAGTAGYIVGTNMDAAVTSRMATYTQPTGFLAATFPGTVASTTNITAGTISTVTTLTNLPSIPANWLTAAGIAASALDGKGNWNIGKTGYSLTTAPPTATENADALLNRDMSAVSDTNARSPLNALRFIRNKWSTSGTTLTVCKENDVDAAWTATVSTNAAADPIVGNDPA